MNLELIQEKLKEYQLDGWLFYDLHGSNRFAREILAISKESIFTRRFFYWIPKEGTPHKLVHAIESNCLDHLPGKKLHYLSWTELEKNLTQILKNVRTIAMEYSPRSAIPTISVIDAGTMDIIKGIGLEVKSSADLLQYFFASLDERQIESHFQAEEILKKTLNNVWELIAQNLRKGHSITEYDVQQFILSEFTAYDCITADNPICGVNENSALPHYVATKKETKLISKGDFILVDLWCKKNVPYGIYADMTHVGIAAPEPTPKHQKIFEIVRDAQVQTTGYIRGCLKEKKPLHGFEVDQYCRHLISKKGYGPYFLHRTGHSIDTEVHGSGANLDDLETKDMRQLIPASCFSLEPAIYIEGEFGVRLEYNGLINSQNDLIITCDVQESIYCLL